MYTATMNTNRKFHYAMPMISNIIYAITDAYWRCSSKTISCCAKCFTQIEMVLMDNRLVTLQVTRGIMAGICSKTGGACSELANVPIP